MSRGKWKAAAEGQQEVAGEGGVPLGQPGPSARLGCIQNQAVCLRLDDEN